jgi:hypothetical protein
VSAFSVEYQGHFLTVCLFHPNRCARSTLVLALAPEHSFVTASVTEERQVRIVSERTMAVTRGYNRLVRNELAGVGPRSRSLFREHRLNVCLVRGICGSLIRSRSAGKAWLAQPANPLPDGGPRLFFLASCLSNQFDLLGKRSAVREDPISRGPVNFRIRRHPGAIRWASLPSR